MLFYTTSRFFYLNLGTGFKPALRRIQHFFYKIPVTTRKTIIFVPCLNNLTTKLRGIALSFTLPICGKHLHCCPRFYLSYRLRIITKPILTCFPSPETVRLIFPKLPWRTCWSSMAGFRGYIARQKVLLFL